MRAAYFRLFTARTRSLRTRLRAARRLLLVSRISCTFTTPGPLPHSARGFKRKMRLPVRVTGLRTPRLPHIRPLPCRHFMLLQALRVLGRTPPHSTDICFPIAAATLPSTPPPRLHLTFFYAVQQCALCSVRVPCLFFLLPRTTPYLPLFCERGTGVICGIAGGNILGSLIAFF